MVLIIGGAYQGKLEYVKTNYPEKSIFQCEAENPYMDLSAGAINSLHLLTLAQIRTGIDAQAYLYERLPEIKDKVIICDDISCGVVPIDSETRKWREVTGRCLSMLSQSADEVVRVFCGIGRRIK